MVEGLARRYPDAPAVWSLAGRAFREFGDADRAMAAWEKCIALDGRCVEAHLGIGAVCIERADYEKAEIALGKAIALQPDSIEGTVLLATALIHQGKFREAASLLEPRVQGPHAPMPFFLLLGQAYLQLKEFAKAKPCFETAVRMAPDYANAHYGLAMACSRLGLKQEAEEHFQRFRAVEAARLSKQVDAAQRPRDDAGRVRQSAAEVYATAAGLLATTGETGEANRLRREAEKLFSSSP